MLKLTKDDRVDFDKYEERIRKNGYIYMRPCDIFPTLDAESIRYQSLTDLATRRLTANSGGRFYSIDQSNVLYDYFTECEFIDEKIFKSGNKQGYSISKKILEPLYKRGSANDFLEAYMLRNKKKSLIEKLNKILQFLKANTTEEVDEDGTPVCRLYYNVNRRQNFRYNYSDYDVITIPKSVTSSICAPSGKFLAWGDFAQSDLRIAYNLLIRDKDNEKIIGECEDMYEGFARMLSLIEGEEFDIDNFKEQRNLYKVNTLSGIFGKTGDRDPENSAFLKKLRKLLEHCPKYMEYEKRAKRRLSLNKPMVIHTYFGEIETFDSSHDNKYNPENKTYNTPMQANTSLLVIFVTNAILDRFYSMGYTEEDISIYMVRHDEPVFILSENIVKDLWVFKDFSRIMVDDWTPLAMDFEFGSTYKVPSRDLTTIYETQCELHENDIKVVEPEPHMEELILPIIDVCEISIGVCYHELEDTNIVCFYIHDLKVAGFAKIKTEDLKVKLEQYICLLEDFVTDNGYTDIIVCTDIIRKETVYSKHFVEYRNSYDTGTQIAYGLAYWMKYSLEKKINPNAIPHDVVKRMEEDIKKVKIVDLFQAKGE